MFENYVGLKIFSLAFVRTNFVSCMLGGYSCETDGDRWEKWERFVVEVCIRKLLNNWVFIFAYKFQCGRQNAWRYLMTPK